MLAGAVRRIQALSVGREFGTFGIEAFLEPTAILECPLLPCLNESNKETR